MLDLESGERGSIAILEAETGSGKTEAALSYFARLFHAGLVDGMYFALPTHTAATQIYRRVCEARDHLFAEANRPPVVLAVPGYIEVDGASGQKLAPFRVLWNDDPAEERRYKGWAAEHPKRYLAGAIAVGTIDQVLLSSLVVSHAHMRSSALLRHLLVVDEVHASDAYMNRILEEVLDNHLHAGGHALLMSATLGAAARIRLLSVPKNHHDVSVPDLEEAVGKAYPMISVLRIGRGSEEIPIRTSGERKQVSIELAAEIESPDLVAARALSNAQAGARVIVVRNTVTGCIETQIALERMAASEPVLLFSCGSVPAPHHSRYSRADRRLLDGALEASFGFERPPGGQVVVATQTVEQSLDLDCDLLISDLCPMDVLLQRVGRLHRHDRHRPAGFEHARVVVLAPTKDLVELLKSNGETHGINGLGSVYEDLRVIEATLRQLRDSPSILIPHDNRRLVEGGTHPKVLESLCKERGGPWLMHHQRVIGELLGQGLLGSLNVIQRGTPFGEDGYLFPSADLSRRIQTRLGEGDRLARFKHPQRSPFSTGVEITEVTIPYHLVAPGTPADEDNAEDVRADENGFSFRFGLGRYTYNRLGLSKENAREEVDDAQG
jgi:CRISPR-associated endonuclease/helicase Cas3